MSKAVAYVRTRPIPEHKVRRVKELADLFLKYDYCLLVNITGITAPVLHESRAILHRRGSVLKVVKNTLTKIAIDRIVDKKPGLKALKEYLKGQNAIIFTNDNPFEIKLFLDKTKITRAARPGDVATKDIVIPAGNTNLPPGPVLSIFGKFKIPTKIQEGSIWVMKDTVVAKAGDTISAELAELLNKLGIQPIEEGLKVKLIYLDGRAIKPEEIEFVPETLKEQVASAHASAVNLAINACLPVADALPVVLARAHAEAMNLAANVCLPIPDSVKYAVARAAAEAEALKKALEAKGVSL